MLFTSPLWLFALLPWAGVVLWLLWGRRRKTPVAFLDLWKGPALQKPAKRALQPPPLFLGFAIFAMLLALLGGAKPWVFVHRGAAGEPVTIIVDRGMSMSAQPGGIPKFKGESTRAGDELVKASGGSTPVELVVVPGDGIQGSDLGSWVAKVGALSPTAIDTRAMLEETVRERLANGSGAVVVISDQKLAMDDPRLIQFSSPGVLDNVGIVQISARETPSPEVMLRLRNDSDRKTVAVKAVSGAQMVSQTVDLPPRGQVRDYFFDLAKMESTIEISLDVKDDQPADDRAWLVREGSYPKIEARSPISAELRRMVEVYAHSRQATDGSQTVAIVGNEADASSDSPTVWRPPANGSRVHGNVTSVADAVTANVNWSAFPQEVQIGGEPPRGWTALVSLDGHVIVASRAEPVRRVWVGFEAPAWAATPDFVVFWANVLTWTGQGQERFAGYPLAKFELGWKPVEALPGSPAPSAGQWPGLYRTDDGMFRAYNPPAIDARKASAVDTSDWRERIIAMPHKDRVGYNLSPVLLVLAMLMLVGAALTWKRRGLTPVSAGRTF